jgi:hypothetical protein
MSQLAPAFLLYYSPGQKLLAEANQTVEVLEENEEKQKKPTGLYEIRKEE